MLREISKDHMSSIKIPKFVFPDLLFSLLVCEVKRKLTWLEIFDHDALCPGTPCICDYSKHLLPIVGSACEEATHHTEATACRSHRCRSIGHLYHSIFI